MTSYVSPFKDTGVVQFEDTLSEEDCTCCDLIYEHYCLREKLGMSLTWLQVWS